MTEVKARLIKTLKRTPTVESFRFMLPEKLNFMPGQFLQVIFDTKSRENKELNKYLSFSCSPAREYIEVTKRISNSNFCGKLKELKINDEILVRAPLGACVFKDEYKKIGFLIGGIGITPVISIIEYIIDKNLDTDVSLVYSNRTEEEIAFKSELDSWCSINKNISISYVITDCQPKDKTCIYGSINKGLISDRVCDLNKRIVFIFGPPKMVETMKTLAEELNCSADNIKTESFVGY